MKELQMNNVQPSRRGFFKAVAIGGAAAAAAVATTVVGERKALTNVGATIQRRPATAKPRTSGITTAPPRSRRETPDAYEEICGGRDGPGSTCTCCVRHARPDD